MGRGGIQLPSGTRKHYVSRNRRTTNGCHKSKEEDRGSALGHVTRMNHDGLVTRDIPKYVRSS
jgi:hypothetical protein